MIIPAVLITSPMALSLNFNDVLYTPYMKDDILTECTHTAPSTED